MDNLFEQFATISKAHAYDIVSKQRDELVEENKALREALQAIEKESTYLDNGVNTAGNKQIARLWSIADKALKKDKSTPPSNEGQQGCDDDPDDLKILEESYKK